MDLKKSVLIAGTGKSGICAGELLISKGAKIIFFDEDPKGEVDVAKILAKFPTDLDIRVELKVLPEDILDEVGYMVLSPGISIEAPFVERVIAKGIPVYSEIELAYQFSKGEIAAITGTNGKTTTTSLVGAIMEAYNPHTYVVGNIGIPYTMVVNDTTEDSSIVAEISSFQLEAIEQFRPKVSALLNLTPDHLNRHHTMEIYGDTKLKIAINQTEDDVIILNYDDELVRPMATRVQARVVFFSRLEQLEEGICMKNGVITLIVNHEEIPFFKPEELKLLGGHNIENVMAAIGITYFMGVDVDTIKKICLTFSGVEHRIEYVKTVKGVDYFNDSKGTNPDAAIKAVEAMIKPTLLIGGGYDKKVPFDDWVKTFKGRVKYLVLIGATAKDIGKTCDKYEFSEYEIVDTFEEAIEACYQRAISGDAVLLSPACASWGMFDNYEQRGDMFKEYVGKLGE